MSDGPYDFARERHLAERGVDLERDADGKTREVRRGPLPPEEVLVAGVWINRDHVPAELLADHSRHSA